MIKEPKISINGTVLNDAQALTIRVSLSHFRSELSDYEFLLLLGDIGTDYKRRVDEIFALMAKLELIRE